MNIFKLIQAKVLPKVLPQVKKEPFEESFEVPYDTNTLIMIVIFELIWNIIIFGFFAPFLWNSVKPAIMSSKPIDGIVLFKTAMLISIMLGSTRVVI